MRTTGTQLFDARNVLKSQIEKGILTINHDGNIVLNGKFDDGNKQFSITLQPGTYTLSGDDNAIWHIISSNGDGIFKQTLVVDVETTYNCYIDGNTYNNHITMPMINIGDSAKPYEPYTGGKPSPSPNYPQKIKTTEIKSIKISGENLLNGVRNTFVPLFLKKGTKLTLIAEEPSPHGVNIVLKDVDGGNLWLSLTNTELKKSMILSKDIKGYEARIVKGNYSMVIGLSLIHI